MRILGFDPGRENFAWAVYSGYVERFGWIHGNKVGECDLRFLDSVAETLDSVKPTKIIVERFA